ncbi:MAG: hypothetical protein WEB06_12685 [Actinomycetota bacterium]
MTIADLRCDACGRYLTGPAGSSEEAAGGGSGEVVRIMFHPGDGLLKDDSTLFCRTCWSAIEEGLGVPDRMDVCARCSVPVASTDSLHVSLIVGGPGPWPTWQLCRVHAVEYLNRLRTTDPKLTDETLSLRSDFGLGERRLGRPLP